MDSSNTTLTMSQRRSTTLLDLHHEALLQICDWLLCQLWWRRWSDPIALLCTCKELYHSNLLSDLRQRRLADRKVFRFKPLAKADERRLMKSALAAADSSFAIDARHVEWMDSFGVVKFRQISYKHLEAARQPACQLSTDTLFARGSRVCGFTVDDNDVSVVTDISINKVDVDTGQLLPPPPISLYFPHRPFCAKKYDADRKTNAPKVPPRVSATLKRMRQFERTSDEKAPLVVVIDFDRNHDVLHTSQLCDLFMFLDGFVAAGLHYHMGLRPHEMRRGIDFNHFRAEQSPEFHLKTPLTGNCMLRVEYQCYALTSVDKNSSVAPFTDPFCYYGLFKEWLDRNREEALSAMIHLFGFEPLLFKLIA